MLVVSKFIEFTAITIVQNDELYSGIANGRK